MRYYLFYSTLFFSVLLINCTANNKLIKESKTISFTDIKTTNFSSVISKETLEFIELKCLENDLIFRAVDQIQIVNNTIYILDTYGTNTLYLFDYNGNFLNSLSAGVGGPGEFFMPVSFVADESNNRLWIKDLYQDVLLGYNLSTLLFVEKIDIPQIGSFVWNEDKLIFFIKTGISSPIVVANNLGQIENESLIEPAFRYNHYNTMPYNFYVFDNLLHTYLPFSYDVYTINTDTSSLKYQMDFGKYSIPKDFNFDNLNSEVNKYMMENPVVRLIYPIETNKNLLVSYYIQLDLYLGIYNKKDGSIINTDVKSISDNFGWGGLDFPKPLGNTGDKIISILYPEYMDSPVIDKQLHLFMENMEDNQNPILFLYEII